MSTRAGIYYLNSRLKFQTIYYEAGINGWQSHWTHPLRHRGQTSDTSDSLDTVSLVQHDLPVRLSLRAITHMRFLCYLYRSECRDSWVYSRKSPRTVIGIHKSLNCFPVNSTVAAVNRPLVVNGTRSLSPLSFFSAESIEPSTWEMKWLK